MQITNSAVNDYISNILPVSPSRVSVRAKTLIKKKIEKLASASIPMGDNLNFFSNGEWVFQINQENDLRQVVSVSKFEKSWGTSLTKTASHGVGWSYIRLPLDIKRGMKKIRDMIDQNDIGDDGKESNPHITVKYGLVTKDPEEVKKSVEHNKGGKVRMGKTSVFKNDDADVLKVSVTSSGLGKLWDSLSTLKNEDRFDKYVAHATLAYLKPGTGDKYVGIDVVDGEEFTFDSFVFEDANDVKTEIKLEGSKVSKIAQTEIDDFSDLGFGEFEISDTSSFSEPTNNVQLKDPDSMLRNNVPTTGSEAYMIEFRMSTRWTWVGYCDLLSQALKEVFSSQELAVTKLAYYNREGLSIEKYRVVKCNFAVKFRENSNIRWQDAKNLDGKTFSTHEMAINYFRDFYNKNYPKRGEFSVVPQRIENGVVSTPGVSTEDNPYYMIEKKSGSGWELLGKPMKAWLDEYDMIFKTETLARQFIDKFPRENYTSELRASPCELVIKTRVKNSDVPWRMADRVPVLRFFDPTDAESYIKDMENAQPNMEFVIFPTRLENIRSSSKPRLSKTAGTTSTAETIKLDSKVVDNHDTSFDVELSFIKEVSKGLYDNSTLIKQVIITVIGRNGQGGRWSWYLKDLRNYGLDKLYLDHGADWYVTGVESVIQETFNIMRSFEKKVPEDLGPIDDFSDLNNNFDFFISGSTNSPVKIAEKSETIKLDSKVVDNYNCENFDVELILEKETFTNFETRIDRISVKRAKIAFSYKSDLLVNRWSWSLDTLKKKGSDRLYLDHNAGWYVQGVDQIIKEAVHIIHLIEHDHEINHSAPEDLGQLDDFSDLSNDFDFSISGSAKQPVKTAGANHLTLGLNSEAIDGSGNLYDAHLIIEEKSIKNSYDITTIPKIRLTLGNKSYTWKLLDQIKYGSDTICINSANRVYVSGIIDILKEAKRIFEDRTGIKMPEIVTNQQSRTPTPLIPKTETKPKENPVDDFSDLYSSFDFNINSGL